MFAFLYSMNVKFSNNAINFKSGLTNKILLNEKSINIEQQELNFAENFGIESKFLENKSGALANQLCLEIFADLSNKLNLNLTVPPAIFLYDKNQLLDFSSSANFCIPDTKEVLKNEYPFSGRSIFFRNFKNLEEIDNNTEYQYHNKISSSSHFLAPFIHEWIHSFHLDYIFKTFGYGGDCEYLNEIYLKQSSVSGVKLLKFLETKTLSSEENEIIFKTLGNYSTLPINQYLEIFAETLTKFICESLKDCKLIKNPFEQLKNANPEFKKIFQKICLFK